MKNSTIDEIKLKIKNSGVENVVNESKIKAKELQIKCNSFVTIVEEPEIINKVSGELYGIPYGVKDNLSTAGILSTGSSNTLKNYVPFFDATVITKLKEAGAVIGAKTALDEFGMGGTGETAHTGIIKNNLDTLRSAGGSSTGSAVCVSAGVYPFALGSDTGDSVRKPASYTGIVGYKPTYGMISRYGLFAFASSLDTIGVFANTTLDAATVVNNIKGIDSKDLTTWDSSKMNLTKNIGADIKEKKICYIEELTNLDNYDNPDESVIKVLNNFHDVLNKLQNNGIVIEKVNIDKNILYAVNSAYTVISSAEATSNMSNLTGITFGPRAKADNYVDMMKKYRTEGFSPLIKRRFVIGSFVLEKENKEKYFHNAQRLRRLIVNIYSELMEKYDGIILPAASSEAKLLSDLNKKCSKEVLALDNHMQIGNFGGFPSITIPAFNVNDLPVGINITSNRYEDEKLLNIANKIEELLEYKGANHE